MQPANNRMRDLSVHANAALHSHTSLDRNSHTQRGASVAMAAAVGASVGWSAAEPSSSQVVSLSGISRGAGGGGGGSFAEDGSGRSTGLVRPVAAAPLPRSLPRPLPKQAVGPHFQAMPLSAVATFGGTVPFSAVGADHATATLPGGPGVVTGPAAVAGGGATWAGSRAASSPAQVPQAPSVEGKQRERGDPDLAPTRRGVCTLTRSGTRLGCGTRGASCARA